MSYQLRFLFLACIEVYTIDAIGQTFGFIMTCMRIIGSHCQGMLTKLGHFGNQKIATNMGKAFLRILFICIPRHCHSVCPLTKKVHAFVRNI